jgi:hypothetical protein
LWDEEVGKIGGKRKPVVKVSTGNLWDEEVGQKEGKRSQG